MIFFQTRILYTYQMEKLLMATRNQSELPRTPNYTHLEPLPDPIDDLEAREDELEDELEAARNRIQEERTARQDAERRAAEAEAEVARLRERLRRLSQG